MPLNQESLQSLLFRAVLILAELACRHPQARLSNSEVIAMQQALFEVLEQLNDLQSKNADGGAHDVPTA